MFSLRKYSSSRFIGLVFLVLVFVTVCIYYGSYSGVINVANPTTGFSAQIGVTRPKGGSYTNREKNYGGKFVGWSSSPSDRFWTEIKDDTSEDACPAVLAAKTNVDTMEQFSKFEFQPFWLKNREYWDESFEDRYKQKKKQWSRLPLKVIVVPHSHNDPGWLKTFEGYYHSQTRNILNHMVDKLSALKNMTFIWSEMSFFSQWWDSAHLTKKRIVQQMLEEGRLEIVTGGWVMTDEATTHIYAMLDQLIEGHQWIKNNLGINVKTGWAVDPFGHSSTVPYLLKASGVSSGTVIQRIHYSWKQWLAKEMMGDFLWRQNWDSAGYTDMLVHNQPFDIYSIKHSCGPHPQVCTYYDFRKVPGEFGEHSLRAVPIDEQNVKQKAETLLEQYERTGSLFPHNVILVPLGDDFRYDQEVEWEQQYRNYKRLMDYINGRKEIYNAEVAFGTPGDYFEEVRNRMTEFATLKGDFFVYSDIFAEGRPAYWSGYYTTRPYWKLLDRELERNLRSAEILYTFGLNAVRQRADNDTVKVMERNYEKLVRARQYLALFQHHDAITGTSKAFVMRDYALKLIEGIQDTIFLQTYVVQNLLFGNLNSPSYRVIVSETDVDSYDTMSSKVLVTITKRRKIAIFNSFAQSRQEAVKLQVNTPHVKIADAYGNVVAHQVNPVWNVTRDNGRASVAELKSVEMLKNVFELLFVVELPPLSLNVFAITVEGADASGASLATVYCQHCRQNDNVFQAKTIQVGDVQLENRKIRALFDGKSGFMKSVTKKDTEKRTFCEMTVGAYQSAQFHSGAYLFMPDPNSRDAERDVSPESANQIIIIASGPLASEITVVSDNLFTHSSRLYHAEGPLSEGVYMENTIDFGPPPKNRETELFVRFSSAIDNGDPATFYTDTNGMQMQKRVTVERIGIEGNYYPITTGAYIEDDEQRLSLLVDHSQGASSWQPGWLEVMVDRRTLYDDARGMGEGLVDNKKISTKYWLLLEDVKGAKRTSEVSRPSLLSNYLSNDLLYPPNMFIMEESPNEEPSTPRSAIDSINSHVRLISKALPCDVHLLNLRTITDHTYTQFPSKSALMILHRQGFSCDISAKVAIPDCYLESVSSHKHSAFRPETQLNELKIKSVVKTSLTGVHRQKDYQSLDEVNIFPMDLLTLNVTFGS